MSDYRRILVVDDTPQNTKLLVDLLSVRDYTVTTASSGPEALESIRQEPPDLVLLDVMMPGMSGYDVCRTLRDQPETALLPIVLVTALDPDTERVKGIEAGADDFLSKPFNTAELLARVRSLLRIRELHEKLAEWNRTLERRVEEQIEKLTRLERLRKFFAPQVADLIANGGEKLLAPHRRRITVVFLDLRGFTSFAERAEPEELTEILSEYYAAMGSVVTQHEGTLERFTGDGLMVFFNDPVEVSDPELRAVRMALAMHEAFADHRTRWLRRGHDLGLGIGIEVGYATLGLIGYEERVDYSATGTVCNQAARLCAAARDGQVLVSGRLLAEVEDAVDSEPIGEIELKGIGRPVQTHNVVGLREDRG